MRHFFVRDTKEFPVACIATEQTPDNKIHYALSICNPLDFQNFDTDRARSIAEERLKKYLDGGYTNYVNPDPSKPDFGKHKVGMIAYTPAEKNAKLLLLTALHEDTELPKRFRKAAHYRIEMLLEAAKKRNAAEATPKA